MKQVSEIANSKKNQVLERDLPIHRWYQFVLGYPPHLVRYYLDEFNISRDQIVLDPFCGTGTTNVECLKNGINNYGIEANPIAHFASKVKTNLKLDIEQLKNYFGYICQSVIKSFEYLDIRDNYSPIFVPLTDIDPITIKFIPLIDKEKQKVIPTEFISKNPLNKVLIIKEIIYSIPDEALKHFFMLSLANLIVNKAGNIAFGPEIYRTKPKQDIDSINYFTAITENMIRDLERSQNINANAQIVFGDARRINEYLNQSILHKINSVITSPPYPNEKDYTRSTRLESVLLDFINNKKDLRNLKENLLRSNSRNIFVNDTDSKNVKNFGRILQIAETIEKKRIELNKDSGFERLYHKIVLHYFGGMFLHFKNLKPFLAHGARLAYVVGDQMSFFRIHIPTAELLAEIAEYLGYKVVDIEIWRTRIATATKKNLDENVLILEYDQ